MDPLYVASKEKEREREKEKEKEKDKERERELEMEAALYTNCLLLGLDVSILGQGGMPRSGLFKHSNPRMGETLLHFLLSALRGPAQSAKDFAGVWPIFDAGQSRDFRKIVQNLINELEAQGALPRSNSRVSSLATCCGPRFVELLWQLSAHALREVHKRSFPADVSANPLPTSLTEVAQCNHASALLTVTKARIALERRRFLDDAAAVVRRQAVWSSLAHDMTAEYRALCAEEAYLHQELDKLEEPKKLRDRDSQNSSENSTEERRLLSVSRATHHWDSLLNHTAQHEKLASGPIEDLLAHREHRYRVSGPALRAAMERSSSISSNDVLSFRSDEVAGSKIDQMTSGENDTHANGEFEMTVSILDDKSLKGVASLDVAEVLRRWTHSLQRIHKQSLRLGKSNDGAGPDIIRDTSDETGHAEALRATVAEHKQHLANIQTLIRQLKESLPGMEASIASLREQVSRTTPLMVPPTSLSLLERMDDFIGHGADTSLKASTSHLELTPASSLSKLPHIFSSSSPTKTKTSQPQRTRTTLHSARRIESSNGDCSDSLVPTHGLIKVDLQGEKEDNLTSLRQAVHIAALSASRHPVEEIITERNDHGTEHFFTPIVSGDMLTNGHLASNSVKSTARKLSPRTPQEYHEYHGKSLLDTLAREQEHKSIDVKDLQQRSSKPSSKLLNSNGFLNKTTAISVSEAKAQIGSESLSGEFVRPFSPPLLTELSSFTEGYDDLLGAEDFLLSDVSLEGVWFNPAG